MSGRIDIIQLVRVKLTGWAMATVYWYKKTLKDGSERYYVRSKVQDVIRPHGGCRTLREAQTLKGTIIKSIADG